MKLKCNEPDLEDVFAFQHIWNEFYRNARKQVTRKYFFCLTLSNGTNPVVGIS